MSSIESLDPRLRSIAAETYQSSVAPNPSSSSPSTALPYQSPQLYLQQPPVPDHDGGDGGDGGGNGGGHNDLKRPRACEACRGLKVRCDPDPNNPDGPCKRCAKAKRNCMITVPSRKRQKKTDSRVAELEKKIDALTATLHAQKSGGAAEQVGLPTEARLNPYQQVTNGGVYGSPYAPRPPEDRSDGWTGYPKLHEFDTRKGSAPPVVVAGQKRKPMESCDPSIPGSVAEISFLSGGAQQKPQIHEYADVIDRGIVSSEMATRMFNSYVDNMTPHFPAVVFPPGTTAADVRKTKPTLFLAILSAASGSSFPKIQKMLTKEVMSIYAERIMCNGEKTLELIEALHVSTLWYYPPEHFEELKFYQLIHIAAVMAIDLGMGKKNKSAKDKVAGLWRDYPWRRTPYPDPESIDARRTWLVCYFLCSNASMGLRRPNLLRWTPFMGDCVEVIESSPEAQPYDKMLCQWVRLQRIAEDIGNHFSMDEPAAIVNISEPKVQYALKGFERDLEKWYSGLQPDTTSQSMKMMGHVVNLYMHEVAMHVDHNIEEFKPPFTEATLRGTHDESDPKPLTPVHVSALSICLTSIDGIFETFMAFDADTIRCLPVANFMRVAYAVVVLIKMYFAAATPTSELGKVIEKDDMKVEQYLDGLVEVFKSAASNELSRPSSKFLMVLLMLKTWFQRQRDGNPEPMGESIATTREPLAEQSAESKGTHHAQRAGFSPANTPLQLLSEVATGNSGGQSRSGSVSNYPGSSNDWQQQQQASFPNYVPTAQYPTSQTYGNLDSSLVMDLGYVEHTLEQAMGLTLGTGDFGAYFGDNTIIGGLMGSNGESGFEGF